MHKRIIFIMLIFLVFTLNCFGKSMKDVLKGIADRAGIWAYIVDTKYNIVIYDKNKTISFYTNSPSDPGGGVDYILYAKVTIDEKNKRISYYKADGRLIITIEVLNEKKDVRIVDYGKWLTFEDGKHYEPVSSEELHVMLRFDGQNFTDIERVYKSEW